MLRYLNAFNKGVLLDITGNFDAFKKKKCICTFYVWLNNEKKTWRIINVKEDTPKPREDWFVLTFFRAYCDSILTTGKILREEAAIYEENYRKSFLEFEELEALFKRSNYAEWLKTKKINQTKRKDILVLTNSLKKKFIMEFPFFQCDYVRKIIYTNPEYKSFLDKEREQDLQYSDFLDFHSHPSPSVQTALQFLQKDLKAKNTYVEMGSSLSNLFRQKPEGNPLSEENPIEYFVLTVLDGLIDKKSLGPEFCSLDDLLVHFNHIHTSKLITDGINNWKFAVFEKKKKYHKLPVSVSNIK